MQNINSAPPHSRDAEMSVLGSILIERNAIDRVIDTLMPEDFYDSGHQMIFNAMRSLHFAASAIDVLTVAEWLSSHELLDHVGGKTYINELTDHVLTASHIAHYAKIVKDKSGLRKLRNIGSDIVELSQDEALEPTEAIEKIQSELSDAFEQLKSKDESFNVKASLKDYKNEVDRRKNQGRVGLETGFFLLDKWCPIEPTHLVILAARPGIGKSAIALNIAWSVMRSGRNVAYFSLEMSPFELMNRLAAHISGVSGTRFKYGNPPVGVMLSVEDAISQAPGDLVFEYVPGASKSDILNRAKTMDADLIIVDHIDLMQEKGRKGENESTTIGRITSAFKAHAARQKCSILCLSQFNRESKGSFPQIHQLRGSGAKEQDSDAVLILHRDQEPDSDVEPVLRIAKNRHGQEGDIKLFFDGPTTTFREADPPPRPMISGQELPAGWEVVGG